MTVTEINLDAHLATPIQEKAKKAQFFAGIIGDRPSQSAKSPHLWNPSFKSLKFDAVFLPFDVDAPKLKDVVDALRQSESYLGGSVTVPYKVDVIPFLDEVEMKAGKIGAVNTIVRTKEGKLVGYNTDGQGAIDNLTRAIPGQAEPFIKSLKGLKVVMLGAGGAGKATAFFLADAIGKDGSLTISNRSNEKGKSLADSIQSVFGNTRFANDKQLESALNQADLIVNATSLGQSGLRSLPNRKLTCNEPYSPLGPVDAIELDSFDAQKWFQAAQTGIEKNNEISAKRILATKPNAKLFDLIFSPFESTFLRQARLSGRATINGKGMNIWQAVDGFCNKVMKGKFQESEDKILSHVFEVMASVW